METSIIKLDPAIATAPTCPQFSRIIDYENNTGLHLSVHCPAGMTVNLRPRETSCIRKVLSIYVTYVVPSTVEISGVVESDKLTEEMERHLIENGRLTLKYDLTDIEDLLDGKMVLVDNLKLGVLNGYSKRSLYPEGPTGYSEPTLLLVAGSKHKFVVTPEGIKTIRGNRGNARAKIAVIVGGERTYLDEDTITFSNIPIKLAESKDEAVKFKEQMGTFEVSKTKAFNDLITNSNSFSDLYHEKITEAYRIMGSALLSELAEERKYEREERQGNRKDTSEMLKWAPDLAKKVSETAVKML